VEFRNSLVVAGRHVTGRCGFLVDDSFIPGLREIKVLEIFDADTGLLVYRRAPLDSCIPRKLLRLETRLLPFHRIDDAIKGFFRHHYCNAERAGLESTTQMFMLNEAHSTYISGRLFYRNFDYGVDSRGFSVVCMIQDPFEELAERLIYLRQVARRDRDRLDARDAIVFEAAIAMASEIDLVDDRQLRKRIGRINFDEVAPLTSPLARQLSARNAYEMPSAGSLATALDALSACTIVGLRAESSTFSSALASFLGVSVEAVPVIGRSLAAVRLAEQLRQIRIARQLLELDLELYQHVVEAYATAAEAMVEPAGVA